MKFVSAIWKLLVGVKDALVLLLLMLFFAGLYGALSARPAAVRDGVLDLNLNGSVVEQPARRQWADIAGSSRIEQYRLRDLVASLDKARDDSRVKAVALDLDGFTGGGATAIGDLADAVRRVRQAGKPVIAYGVGFTDDSYALASAASEIWLNPLGGVLIAGPGGSNLYYKGLLDKLGVTANVYRVGTYKSAVEPFIRNDMSPEAKANYTALDQARLETWRQEIRQARPKANIDLFLTNMNGAVAAAGGDMAKAALQAGLVDRIGDRRAFEARLADLGGGTGRDGAGFRADQARVLRRRRRRQQAERADRRGDDCRHDRRRQGRPGQRRRRHHRQGDRGRHPQQGHQGAGRSRRQPRGLGPRLRAHPPGAA